MTVFCKLVRSLYIPVPQVIQMGQNHHSQKRLWEILIVFWLRINLTSVWALLMSTLRVIGLNVCVPTVFVQLKVNFSLVTWISLKLIYIPLLMSANVSLTEFIVVQVRRDLHVDIMSFRAVWSPTMHADGEQKGAVVPVCRSLTCCVKSRQEFQSTREAKRRFLAAYSLMLDFYGIKLLDKSGNVARAPNWQERFQHLNE